jgi:predicted DNA-binding transcriptional regulator AlpA
VTAASGGDNVDLVRLGDLGHVLGTSRGKAIGWARRDDFPEPVTWLRARPVWDRADVERWAKEHTANR